MTHLALSITAADIDELRANLAGAQDAGADLIELRLDLMDEVADADLRQLLESARPAAPLIFTIRSRAEGGAWDGDDTDRISRLIDLGPLADWLDVELATWQKSANIRQKVGLALRRAGLISQSGGVEEIDQARPRRLILSHHDTQSRPSTLSADLVAMLSAEDCAVPKLAWRARTVRDNFEAFELMRTSPKPLIAVCLGELGLMSRVLARKFGAFATFAALRPGQETADGQIDIAALRDRFRWDHITLMTAVYGVVGDPVRHSLSPAVHNAAFAAAGLDAVYLPLPVTAGYESFKALMVEIMARPWLDFRGLSITAPHKENALRYLTETGGEVSDSARRAGAVNTLVLAPSESEARLGQPAVAGHNTDGPAALACVRSVVLSPDGSLTGRRVTVLGAGGVARIIARELIDRGAAVTVFNRSPERAQSVANSLGCEFAPWDNRPGPADLVINCTPVGQSPHAQESPLPADRLRPDLAVFDTVYSPRPTRLLRDAITAGCRTIDGLAMFIHQAEAQFEIWTGRKPPTGVVAAAAESELARRAT